MDSTLPRDQFSADSLLKILRRRWWLLLLCVVVGAVSAGVISRLQTKKYQASADLLFRNDSQPDQTLQSVFGLPAAAFAPDPTRQSATDVALVSLDTVANMTANAMGPNWSGSKVKNEIAVQSVGQSDVVSVTATDPNPSLASALANTFAREFIVFRQNTDRSLINSAIQRVESQLNALSPGVASGSGGQALQNRLLQLQALAQIQTGDASLVQSASAPSSPSSPNTKLNIGAGAALGLIVAILLAIVFERFDRRARTPEELAEAYELPLLGVVPSSKELRDDKQQKTVANGVAPPAAVEEAFRAIRARLRYFNVDRTIHSVLVTSATKGEGKSTVAWQLARAIAMTGKGKVLLLETDLRRPRLARSHGLKPFPGLAEVLSHRRRLSSIVQSVPLTHIARVDEDRAAQTDATIADPETRAEGDDRRVQGGVIPQQALDLDGEAVAAGSSSERDENLEGAVVRGEVFAPRMDVIVAGDIPPNPSELLDSHGMSGLLQQLVEHYDYVILDAAPGSMVSDTLPLVGQVSGVIVVSSLRNSSTDLINRLRSQLHKVNAPMLGVVVNHAKRQREDPYSGYEKGSHEQHLSRNGTDPGFSDQSEDVDDPRSAAEDFDQPESEEKLKVARESGGDSEAATRT